MRNAIKIRLPAILLGLLLMFTTCEKEDVTPANLNLEKTPFEVSDNTALEMVNEAVAYSSIGMLFDIRKGAEIAFDHFNGLSKASRCGKTYTTNLSQPYSYRLLGFESDFHVEILCSEYWELNGLKVSTHVKPDYTATETNFSQVEAFGYWTINGITQNVASYPVSGYYVRNGTLRYGNQTHERYYYHFRIDINDLNLRADNFNFKEAVTAKFKLRVTRWSVAKEEEKDFVEGTILFNTNGMFFVELGDHSNVSS